MKVVLLQENINNIVLSKKEAKELLKILPQRFKFNRTIYNLLFDLIKNTSDDNVVLSGGIFDEQSFRTLPSLIYIIEKYNDPRYKIVEISCEYFNITRKRGTEIISSPDLRKWTKGYNQNDW